MEATYTGYTVVKHLYHEGESEPYGFYRKAGPYPTAARAVRVRDIMQNDHPPKDWKDSLDIVEEDDREEALKLYHRWEN